MPNPSCQTLCPMNETTFIEQIDCQFPYGKPLRWRRLSAQAARISPNAVFMVVHEVCRVPRSNDLPAKQAFVILQHLRRRFRHPLFRITEVALNAYVAGHELRESKADSLMRKVAAYPNQYNALALCYLCANDRSGRLDRTYNKVVAKWSTQNQQ